MSATWIIIGLFITIIFIFVNYLISDFDFFNASVIFCCVNFAALLMCFFMREEYWFSLHWNTILVLSLGQFVFTVSNYLAKHLLPYSKKKSLNKPYDFKCIIIRPIWIILFIILELVVAYFIKQYVSNISRALFGGSSSFSEDIGNYNYAIKFMSDRFVSLNMHQNLIIKIGIPVCTAFTYILIVVVINNYIAVKKIEPLIIFAIVISVVISFLTGSRSEAFRYVTFALCASIIAKRRSKGSFKKGNFKLLIRSLFIVLLVALGALGIRSFLGRSTTYDATWQRAIFPYFGSPILNLDIALNSKNIYKSDIFGEQTFYQIINWTGNHLNIDELKVNLHLPFLSSNGISTGNVYTMYYMFIEDFGYWGIIPLTIIIGIYYNFSYEIIMNMRKNKNPLGLRLFIYCYMFNSLVMLLFSNRFFEHILNVSIWVIFLMMYFIWRYIKKGLFSKKIVSF